MTTEVVKSNKGRKANAEAKDLNTLISKAQWEVLNYDSRCCNDLKDLYKLQRDLAFGTGTLGKNASVTNRKTAISEMIARGESYATGEAPLLSMLNDHPPEEKPADEEQKQVSGGDVVASGTLEEKREAFRKLQAEKKLKAQEK